MLRTASAFIAGTVWLAFWLTPASWSQDNTLSPSQPGPSTVVATAGAGIMAKEPWEYGPFFNGGFGTGDRNTDSFLSVGIHVGKVLTDPHLPSLLRGQFEYAGDIMPWWHAETSKFLRANCYGVLGGAVDCTSLYPTGGGYNGVSITPIILRWNFDKGTRLRPFVQGAGGLIWTNHKFPPVGPYQDPGHQGTSVFNFTPQFGIGMHYFLKPHQSLTFQANAVHISSASLGDSNPGVNASVQFAIGYTWWKE
jgi:lipid A 3-O-deacylase